jgi:hypothetical protein
VTPLRITRYEPGVVAAWMEREKRLIGRVTGCIGCGYCCFQGPCGLSSQVWDHLEVREPNIHHDGEKWVGNLAPRAWSGCPALVWTSGQWRCGLAWGAPQVVADYVMMSLYFGAGCSSGMNTCRRECRPIDPLKIAPSLAALFIVERRLKVFTHLCAGEELDLDDYRLTLEQEGGMNAEEKRYLARVRFDRLLPL